MNYLSHARNHLGRPYALAGTGAPDWMRVSDRRARVVVEDLPLPTRDDDSDEAELIRGMHRHFVDDKWFHQTKVFRGLMRTMRDRLRERHGYPRGLRPVFRAHILIEVLLDAHLIQQRPDVVDRYYDELGAVDPELVATTINTHATRPNNGLAAFIRGYRTYQFLRSYVDDAEVVKRLDQVGGRVGLPRLPRGFVDDVTWARRLVSRNAEALLEPPPHVTADLQWRHDPRTTDA